MKPKEFKAGDSVYATHGNFMFSYCMEIGFIEGDNATCYWYEASRKGLKLKMAVFPIKDLIHDKKNEKPKDDTHSFMVCLN